MEISFLFAPFRYLAEPHREGKGGSGRAGL